MRVFALVLAALTGAPALVFAQVDAGSPQPLSVHAVPLLPSAPGRIGMDYLGYEPGTNQVWAPGANTGRVFVVDGTSEAVRTVEGFPTRELNGRVLGPTSVTFGPGSAFIGNRADNSVCAVDLQTLKRGACVTLPDMPDGLAYVSTTKEVWATTPRSKSLVVLSTEKGLAIATRVQLDGEPEGYAVDSGAGRFYTNLEDKNEVLTIDVRARTVAGRWPTGCSADGPRGMALDGRAGVLVVACTDRLVSFVLGPKPQSRGVLLTGAGVDNIDLAPTSGTVFAAAGKAQLLTRGRLAPDGTLTLTGQAHTSQGVRVVVVTARGKAFAADGAQGALWVTSP
jgi:DNA-binding beta-propeller fold protein YncE